MTIPTDLIELSSTSSSTSLLRQIIDFDSLYLQRRKVFGYTTLPFIVIGQMLLWRVDHPRQETRQDKKKRKYSGNKQELLPFVVCVWWSQSNHGMDFKLPSNWSINPSTGDKVDPMENRRRLQGLHLSNLSKDDDYVQMGCGRSLSVLGSIHSPCLLYH